MYEIDKQSELYKFVNCHFFDQNSYSPGESYGYNFCSYGREILKSALLCVVGYGVLAYLAIFGLAPWAMYLFAGYPAPVQDSMTLIGVACVLTAMLAAAGVLLAAVAGVCISSDNGWDMKAKRYVSSKVENLSITEFVTTAYKAWKGKYCPLVVVIDSKEIKNVD